MAVFYGASCEDYVIQVNLSLVTWWLPAVIVSQEGLPMQAPRRVSKEKYVESMRAEMEGLLGEVMEAVNDAPGGRPPAVAVLRRSTNGSIRPARPSRGAWSNWPAV